VVLRTPERLDPFSYTHMLLRAIGARHLPVRNVANEQMLERVLRLSVDRASPRAADELL
jgi:hypothetical protein